MDHHLSKPHPPYTHCTTRIVDLTKLRISPTDTDADLLAAYTDYVSLATHDPNASHLRDAIQSIKYGIAPPVAFPTETVYGLGADAANEASVAGIFAAKGRPADNPLIVHAGSVKHLERVLGRPVPEVYSQVVEQFWPGPLTILLPVPDEADSKTNFAPNVHPGQNTIGFRVPSSRHARFFILACDRLIAGPSANSSGRPSPTTAQHVLEDMQGKINFVLDGGPCDVGVESTVVDGLHDPPLILRPGGVSLEELRAIGGVWANTQIGYERHRFPAKSDGVDGTTRTPQPSKEYTAHINGAPRAPGMKYRHYAPRAKLVLFSEQSVHRGAVQRKLHALYASSNDAPKTRKVGFISCRWPAFAGLQSQPQPQPQSQPQLRSPAPSPQQKPILETDDDDNEPTAPKHADHPALLDRLQHTTYRTASPDDDAALALYDLPFGPDVERLAVHLFGALRLFDALGCDFIFAEMVRGSHADAAMDGHGDRDGGSVVDAVADRLEKAASERVDF